jgi:hypothetical protein
VVYAWWGCYYVCCSNTYTSLSLSLSLCVPLQIKCADGGHRKGSSSSTPHPERSYADDSAGEWRRLPRCEHLRSSNSNSSSSSGSGKARTRGCATGITYARHVLLQSVQVRTHRLLWLTRHTGTPLPTPQIHNLLLLLPPPHLQGLNQRRRCWNWVNVLVWHRRVAATPGDCYAEC